MSILDDMGIDSQLKKKPTDLPMVNPEKQISDGSISYRKIRLAGKIKAGDFGTAALATTSAPGVVQYSTDDEVKAGTATTRVITPANLTTMGLFSGWIPITGTWTYASADAPTYTVTVPSGATLLYSAGMRIKLTDAAATKYFLITAVASTTVTLYGGTDYTLAGGAITNVFASPYKAPLGFPLDPTKWSVEISDSTVRTQASPTQATYYNIGTTNSQITIPIGSWYVSFHVSVYALTAASTYSIVYATLSTANNSESDTTMTSLGYSPFPGAYTDWIATLDNERFLTVTSKTLYYLNEKVNSSAACTQLQTYSADGSGTYTMKLKAICAYL